VLVHNFYQGHSYLMTGNLGAPDLIAGDSFGAPVPQGVPTLWGFQRVDVIAIDPASPSATLRIRYKPGSKATSVAAVDPISLILSGGAYIAWAEGHNPHVPDIADLAAALRSMSVDERSFAVARARVLADTANAVLAGARAIG
jgi:hypothetical protein